MIVFDASERVRKKHMHWRSERSQCVFYWLFAKVLLNRWFWSFAEA
jgi:hypothetical protein